MMRIVNSPMAQLGWISLNGTRRRTWAWDWTDRFDGALELGGAGGSRGNEVDDGGDGNYIKL